ncbi:phosphate acyltransferase PlsX [Candidatus Sumerlaeota bacterium]|nr:phosphate acyltransferase PlsX [Candidatus Sumerlaeota bacterium]
MRIALDAMGSDVGPTPLVEGAVMAAKRFDCKILLVGRRHSLGRLLRFYRYAGDKIEIVPCSQTVRMDANPRASLKLSDSSIAVATRLVAEGRADAMVSAGATGATKAHALLGLRRLEGIRREAIATLMPTSKKPCLILDVGANVDCKPRHLVDFAIMGSVYARTVLGRKNPRVGILSVGEEPSKGNALTLATYALLKQSHLNFIGNVEGRHLFKGKVDVLVCDGFVGNVVLKVCESVAKMILMGVKGAMKKNVLTMAGALTLLPGMRKFHKKVDHSEYGGAPLLGLNGVCIIAHGSSNAKAVMNAVRVAVESVDQDVNRHIREEIEAISAEIEQVASSQELVAVTE